MFGGRLISYTCAALIALPLIQGFKFDTGAITLYFTPNAGQDDVTLLNCK